MWQLYVDYEILLPFTYLEKSLTLPAINPQTIRGLLLPFIGSAASFLPIPPLMFAFEMPLDCPRGLTATYVLTLIPELVLPLTLVSIIVYGKSCYWTASTWVMDLIWAVGDARYTRSLPRNALLNLLWNVLVRSA